MAARGGVTGMYQHCALYRYCWSHALQLLPWLLSGRAPRLQVQHWLLIYLLPGMRCEGSRSLWRAGSLRGLVRQLSIDQFENEGRRVSMGTDSVGKQSHASGRTPMFDRAMSEPGVHKVGRRALWGVCCC